MRTEERARDLAARVQHESAAAREVQLHAACAGDPELRRHVQELLDAFDVAATLAGPRAAAAEAPGVPPEGDRVGPYVLVELLGRGGGGAVYRAVHGESREPAALKVLAAPRPALLGGIRREIQVLARLRHPRIVGIREHGEAQGLPWYAMDLVAGRSLRSSLPSFATLEERLLLAHRLCAPLAYLHGEGIVHRDLKPDNVMLRDGGEPVLVDFGLAALAGRGRDVLEVTGDVVGTLAYMAPEQARGAAVDARADLYALGCILYELLTGRPPFVAEQPAALLWKHQTARPEPPSAHDPAVPPAVDALVLALLAKRPSDRLGFARDVAATLERLGVPPDPAARPTRSYLYRSALLGRDGPMETVGAALASLGRGTGAMLLLRGARGTGRTRLAVETGERARHLGATVLAGSCEPDAAGTPLGALRRPLQALADRLRESGSPAAHRPALRLLAAYEPGFLHVGGVAEVPEPEALAAHAGRQRLFLALSAILVHEAGAAPVVLVLDDLPWADALTLSFLGHLVEIGLPSAASILVIGTLEPAPSRAALRALEEARQPVVIDLAPLDAASLNRMVGQMLALPEPDVALAEVVAQESRGSPFYAAEYLRAAAAVGHLYRDDEGAWRLGETSATPRPALDDLLRRQLAALPGEALRVGAWASAMGLAIDERVLAAASGVEARAVASALTELIAADVVESSLDGSVSFRHERWRTVLYERIPGADRAPVHRAVATAIAAAPGCRAESQLGLHWERAGDLVAARDAHLAAARGAAGRYALEEAAAQYGRYLALGPADPDAVTARTELCDRVLLVRGELAEAAVEASQAVAAAERLGGPGLLARALRTRGAVLQRQGDLGASVETLRRARELARDARDERLEAAIAGDVAAVEDSRGKSAEALSMYVEVLERYRSLGDRASEGLALRNLATCLVEQGRLEEGLARGREALESHRALGQRAQEAATLATLARAERLSGRPEASLERYREALAIAREIGDRLEEGTTLNNMAVLLYATGDVRRARECAEQALAIQRQAGDRRMTAGALGTLAAFLHHDGNLAAARPVYEEAIALIRQVGDRRYEGSLLGNLADLHREEGRPDEWMACLREAVSRHRESSNAEFLAYALVQLGKADLAAGRPAAALGAIEEGLGIARGVGIVPDVVEALDARATVLEALGRREEAAAASAEARRLEAG